MKKLEPYPIASALFYIFTVLYIVCIGVKLILVNFDVEGFWHMHKIWVLILPWFNDLNSLSILIGLLEVSIGSYLIGYIVVPIYNFLAAKKVSEHKIEVKPIIVRFKTLFFTLAFYVSLLFTLCLVYDLIVPAEYQMMYLWKLLLPGFTGLNLLSYLIGLGVIVIYSAYTAFIFSKSLNYFEKSELKKSEKNSISKESSLEGMNEDVSEIKPSTVLKKYDAKYFGAAIGLFTVLIFFLVVINQIFSDNFDAIFLKPYIPFFDTVNALNIIGGIVVSFLWGWLLGYFFMIVYHWFSPSSTRGGQATLLKGKGLKKRQL